jgi:glycyl-tRNA synthetase
MAKEPDLAQKVINLCSRRGLIVQSSEIYGGYAGFFDFVGYGAQLKRNVETLWWKRFVEHRLDVTGLEGSIITHPTVWQASGHAESFNDPLVECEKCHERYRADSLIEEQTGESVDGLSITSLEELLTKHKVACPKCKGSLAFKSPFNLMFKTKVGAKDTAASDAFLRPETAQVIFTNFKTALTASRGKLPFGIAQIGKSFRNEIAPRNFVFRSREFTQMELEYFIHPQKLNDCPQLTKQMLAQELLLVTQDEREKGSPGKIMTLEAALTAKLIGTRWHAYWLAECFNFLYDLGIKPGKLRARKHGQTELSHYSSETWDIEYDFPWGWKELAGLANRTDFDLKQHAAHSGADLSVFDEELKAKVVPYCFEPSFGSERLIFTLLLDAFGEGAAAASGEGSTIVLHLKHGVAPLDIAILPLMKRNGLDEKAMQVFEALKKEFRAEYDASGSVGKRYARYDEVGVPYCVTIDYDTLKDHTVTMRDRETTKQVRLPAKKLADTIRQLFAGTLKFDDAGEPVTRVEKAPE